MVDEQPAGSAESPHHVSTEPDYDHLPRGEQNPMWEVAIAVGIFLAVCGAIIAFG